MPLPLNLQTGCLQSTPASQHISTISTLIYILKTKQIAETTEKQFFHPNTATNSAMSRRSSSSFFSYTLIV